MIKREYWNVLVVDDEPDVLAVTRLALKQIQVYGIPLRIHECTSKVEAIKYLQATAELPDLALAIVDVVMETEHAGLEVCRFIRDELSNRSTPIIVRTGQAGKAPEREVIERYDISTYLTKVEATNEKLYATVVNAVRNYQHAVFNEGIIMLASWITLQTRESFVRDLPAFVSSVQSRRDGAPVSLFHYCILTDRESIAVGNFTGGEAEARTLRDRLAKEPSRVHTRNGDRFVHSGDHVLFSLAGTDDVPVFDLVGQTNFRQIPDYMAHATILCMQSMRNQMAMPGKHG